MPSFEVFDRRAVPTSAEPQVTLQVKGPISFNQAAYLALGEPSFVELLYDKTEKIIGIRAVKEDLPHAYPVRRQGASNTYVIAGHAFRKYYNIENEAAVRYDAQMLSDVLGVDLKQQGVVVTKSRSSASKARLPASG